MIEMIRGKKRTLEMHLNVSEMGSVYGLRGTFLFQETGEKPGQGEAAMIASCLPNPKQYTIQIHYQKRMRKISWIPASHSYQPNSRQWCHHFNTIL